jgi:hypothetical protein
VTPGVCSLALELPPAQADRLRQEAARLGVTPDELARRVLEKSRELYRRLA